MNRFWTTLIRPIFLQLEPRVVVEVGSFRGENTRLLLDYCREHGATLHAIDPLPQFDVQGWQAEYGRHFVFHRAKSLDILRSIESPDIVLIDGDHNWYTVYHELRQLAEAAIRQQRLLPVVLFHDIGWPYARRDLYYNPDDIPPAFRQPFSKSGIVPGRSELHRNGINSELFNAVAEGGPRNGVLTAVEDFVRESDEPLRLILIDGFKGLGILYPESLADQAPAAGAHLARLSTGAELLGGHMSAQEDLVTRLVARSHRQKKRAARAEASTAETP